MEKGGGQRSTLKGRDRAIVTQTQTNIGPVSKTLPIRETLLWDGVERIQALISLNWLNVGFTQGLDDDDDDDVSYSHAICVLCRVESF